MNRQQQYDSIGREYVQKINPPKKYAMPQTLLYLTGDVANKKVLDLACGDGYFTRILAKLNPRKIVGVDVSSTMIDIAKANEKEDPLGIEYIQQDVLSLSLSEEFDITTAVYLLDYASTVEELQAMIQSVYNCLKKGGIFATITLSPKLLPREDYKRGWKIVNPAGKPVFKDGNKMEIISEPIDGPPIAINCYYWSQETYDACFKKVGFKSTVWKYDYEISKEGTRLYDDTYWKDVQKTKTGVGIKCIK